MYEINGPYFFGIATKFEDIMARFGDRPQIRIIRMRKVPFIDSTGIHNLTTLCEMSQKENIHIILSGVNPQVHATLEKSGFYTLLGKENIKNYLLKTFEYRNEILKTCYKTDYLGENTCRYGKSPYICNVFFIVLDLRLTKVGVQRYSFFYAYTFFDSINTQIPLVIS